MPRKAKQARPRLVGRYSQERVRVEIKAVADAAKRGTKARLSRELGLGTPQQFSHRLRGDYEWTLEEIGAVADSLNAPLGWPFLPWAVAAKLTVNK